MEMMFRIGLMGILAVCVALPMVRSAEKITPIEPVTKGIELQVETSEIMSNQQPYELEFYVEECDFRVDSFDLYCNGVGKVGILYDNGDYNNNKDKLGGDGIFTGTVLIDGYTEDTELSFYATANGSDLDYDRTKVVELSIITPFTDKELNDMETVDNEIERLLNEAATKIPQNATREEKIKIRYDMIYPYLKEMEKEGIVKNVYYSGNMINYEIHKASSAVELYNEWMESELVY